MMDTCKCKTVFVVQRRLCGTGTVWQDCSTYESAKAVDKALAAGRYNAPGFIYQVIARLVIYYDVCYTEDGYTWVGGVERSET